MGYFETLARNHIDTLDSWSRRCCRAAGFACVKWSVCVAEIILYSVLCIVCEWECGGPKITATACTNNNTCEKQFILVGHFFRFFLFACSFCCLAVFGVTSLLAHISAKHVAHRVLQIFSLIFFSLLSPFFSASFHFHGNGIVQLAAYCCSFVSSFDFTHCSMFVHTRRRSIRHQQRQQRSWHGLRACVGSPFDERLQAAYTLLESVPLIDGHNDLPYNIRKFVHNQLADFE